MRNSVKFDWRKSNKHLKKALFGLVLLLLLGTGVAAANSAEDDFMAGWRIYFDLVTDKGQDMSSGCLNSSDTHR